MKSRIIKLLQEKGVAVANDATDGELLSVLKNGTFPKASTSPSAPYPAAPALTESSPRPSASQPAKSLADMEVKDMTANQARTLFVNKVEELCSQQKLDFSVAWGKIRALNPALLAKMNESSLGLGDKATTLPNSVQIPIPSDDNLEKMGLPADCDLDAFNEAWAANDNQAEPRQSQKMFDALTRHVVKARRVSGQNAPAVTAKLFPQLATDINWQPNS